MNCPHCHTYLSSLSGGHCSKCGWNANARSSEPRHPAMGKGPTTSNPSTIRSRFALPVAIAFGVVCVLGFAGVMSQMGDSAAKASALASARPGPPFHELDAIMDARQNLYTQAQVAAAWKNAQGSFVSWEGEVVECQDTSGGQITLKCNVQTATYDTIAFLDGTQNVELGSVAKGSRILVKGILQSHDDAGYTVNQARFSPVDQSASP